MQSTIVIDKNELDTFSSNKEVCSSLAIQLERAKEELELVSYLTSHDLQAPLRTILATCEEWNEQKYIPVAQAAEDSLRKIEREARRMKLLMQGLLDYLRLETFGPAHALMDVKEIVDAARTILDERIRATGAKITCDALYQVYGHRGRLTRLFVNLLDNALKFHDQSAPLIHISARPLGSSVEFCIEDDGIGIDEEYQDIVFGLFQRLHTAEDYPGEGIGLALSRKIVESHGGKIWVESALGAGCRFRVTLPIAKPES